MAIKIRMEGALVDPARARQVARLVAAMDGAAGPLLEEHWAREIQARAAAGDEGEWELTRPSWLQEGAPDGEAARPAALPRWCN